MDLKNLTDSELETCHKNLESELSRRANMNKINSITEEVIEEWFNLSDAGDNMSSAENIFYTETEPLIWHLALKGLKNCNDKTLEAVNKLRNLTKAKNTKDGAIIAKLWEIVIATLS